MFDLSSHDNLHTQNNIYLITNPAVLSIIQSTEMNKNNFESYLHMEFGTVCLKATVTAPNLKVSHFCNHKQV